MAELNAIREQTGNMTVPYKCGRCFADFCLSYFIKQAKRGP